MHRKTRKRIRVVLFSLLLLTMSVYLARNLLISQARIMEQAQRELEKMFPGFAVSFESAEPSGVKSIRAERVTVYPKDAPGDHIFHARRVTIVPRGIDLLRGEFRTEEIIFESPTFFVGQEGFSNVTRVLKALAASRLTQPHQVHLVPKVDLRDASLSIPGLQSVPFVDLNLRLVDPTAGMYDIVGTISENEQAVFSKFTWPIGGRYDATSGVLSITVDAPNVDLADDDFRRGVAWLLDLLAKQPDADAFTRHLAREAYSRYDIEGRVNAHLEVDFYQKENRNTFELTLNFPGATRLTIADIPEKVDITGGSLVLTEVGMMAEDLEGTYRGARFTMSGRLDRRFVDHDNRLVLRLAGLEVDKPLVDHLKTGPAERFLNDCALSGDVDVTATLYRHPGEEMPRSRFEITGGSLVGVFRDFPYPAYLRSGTIDWIGDCLTLSDMQLVAVETNVRSRLSGTLTELDRRCPRTDLVVTGKDLPIDKHLVEAVHPKVRDVLKRLNLSGLSDFTCNLTRRPGDDTPLRMDFDLDMHHLDAAPKDVPLKFRDMRGRLVGGPESFRMENFRGRTAGGGHVEFSGRAVDLETRPRMSASFKARDIPLAEALELARDEKGFDVEEVIETAEGKLDMVGDITIVGADRPEDEKWEVDAALKLHEGTLAAGPFPYTWSDVDGVMALHYVRRGMSTLKIEQLRGRGRRRDSSMSLDGKIEFGQGKSWVDLDFAVTDLQLDDNVMGKLPPETAELVKAFRPEGRFDASVELAKSAEDAYRFTARVKLKEVAGKRLGGISSARGDIVVTGTRDGDTLYLKGEARLDSVTAVRKKFRNLQASFEVADKTLNLYRLRGDLYDGRFSGSARIGLDTRAEYSLSARVVGVNMNKFINDIVPDYNGAPLGGLLTGTFKVQGHGTDTKDMVGKGEFKLTGGKIMKFPLALKLMNLLRLSIPADDDFLEALVRYNVVDNTIRLDTIQVGCPSMTVQGKGSISSTGKLDLTFSMGSAAYGIPLVTQIIETVSNPLVQVHLKGKIKDPKLEVDPIAPITAPLRALLGLFAEGAG